MRPDGELAATPDSIILKVGEVKGGLKAMNERMGRMERSLDKGLAEIKSEVRSVSAAIASTATPLDDRITALELKDSERRGERGAWLGLSSLVGGIVVAGGSGWSIILRNNRAKTHRPRFCKTAFNSVARQERSVGFRIEGNLPK